MTVEGLAAIGLPACGDPQAASARPATPAKNEPATTQLEPRARRVTRQITLSVRSRMQPDTPNTALIPLAAA